MDVGAAWIYGITKNPVYETMKGLGMPTASFDWDNSATYNEEGVELTDAQETAIDDDLELTTTAVDDDDNPVRPLPRRLAASSALLLFSPRRRGARVPGARVGVSRHVRV